MEKEHNDEEHKEWKEEGKKIKGRDYEEEEEEKRKWMAKRRII